jgi:hypothetical protein
MPKSAILTTERYDPVEKPGKSLCADRVVGASQE